MTHSTIDPSISDSRAATTAPDETRARLPLPVGFRIARYELTLLVQEPMTLPANKANLFRGGFGYAFKSMACAWQPPRASCEDCPHVGKCAYARVFETPLPPDSPVLKAQKNIPAPYIIHAPRDRRTHYRPGELISFRLTLFGWAVDALPYFLYAFQELGRRGLGRNRTSYELLLVVYHDQQDGHRSLILRDNAISGDYGRHYNEVSPQWPALPHRTIQRVSIRTETPMLIKYQGDVLRKPPPFHVIIRTLLRRLSSLAVFYGPGQWELDYRNWIEQSEAIRLTDHRTRWISWQRYSTRQKQRIPLGGVGGNISYEGDITPFIPLLRLGELIHVGKGAVFGQGAYSLIPR